MTAPMSALLLSVLLSAKGPAVIEDDYARALATAKKSKKLLFVDAWAPWCHTCVFMREHVLNQPAFAAFEREIVFAAIDTEKAGAAPFLDRFPVNTWPTLFFIDPSTEALVFKWIGSADAAQMKALLEAARTKDTPVRDADALLAQGRSKDAADAYLRSVKALSGSSSARATLSMLSALSAAGQSELCARTAAEHVTTLTTPADRVNALTWGLSCALALDAAAADRARLVDELAAQARAALTSTGVLADDLSGLYELLVEERHGARDDAGARRTAADWLAFLEKEAAKARTPAARAVFDPHRLSAAIASRQVERVVATLQLSERQLPADFNPPARLALARKELGQLDLALEDIGRALKKNQGGPRRLRLFEIQASLFGAKGDVANQIRALEEGIAYGAALPASQRPTGRLTALQQQLAAVRTPN